MTDYERFRVSCLDTADIGLDADAAPPQLAAGDAYIGSAGGACFYLAGGLTGQVFLRCADDLRFPVAASFRELIALILACKGTAALCAAHLRSRAGFESAVAAVRPGCKQRSILRALQNAYAPPVIVDPFAYLQQQRGGVPLYAPPVGRRRAVEKQFRWAGSEWYADAAYLDAARITAFLYASAPCGKVHAAAEVNRKSVQASCAVSDWDPQAENTVEALALLEHFGCDRELGWRFLRVDLPRRESRVRALRLILSTPAAYVDGDCIRVRAAGECFDFRNPLTGQMHTLTVDRFTVEVMDYELLTQPPCRYRRMCCRITPNIPHEDLLIEDTQPDDPLSAQTGAGAIGVIGGRRAILSPAEPDVPDVHTACSSLFYTWRDDTQWQLRFRKQPAPDFSIDLIRSERR